MDAKKDVLGTTGLRRPAIAPDIRAWMATAPVVPTLGTLASRPLGRQKTAAREASRPEVLALARQTTIRPNEGTDEAIPAPTMMTDVEALPAISRIPGVGRLREVGGVPIADDDTSTIATTTARLLVVVATVRHTTLSRVVRPQVLQGARAIGATVARVLVPAVALLPVARPFRPASPRMEVLDVTTSLAGLVVATVPARGRPLVAAGRRRTQVPAPVATAWSPANGTLVGVPPVSPLVHACSQTTIPGHASTILVLARVARAVPNAQAVAVATATVGLPYVGPIAVTIGPTILQAARPTDRTATTVPVGHPTKNSAPAEETLPEEVTSKIPEVPAIRVPTGVVVARVVLPTTIARTTHRPATVAAGLESGTGLGPVPPLPSVSRTVAEARRPSLQADAVAGRKVLGPGTGHTVPRKSDARPRVLVTAGLVTTGVVPN